ncbi:MAG: OB-fold domain-containing protein [Dehalococcoidia bacterium]
MHACNSVNFYPTAHCQKWQPEPHPEQVQGQGTVYTFSVVMQNRIPGFRELGAYAVAYVDLDEGFRMLTNVMVDGDPTQNVKIGQRVKVDFEKQDTGEFPIPVFRPL